MEFILCAGYDLSTPYVRACKILLKSETTPFHKISPYQLNIHTFSHIPGHSYSDISGISQDILTKLCTRVVYI